MLKQWNLNYYKDFLTGFIVQGNNSMLVHFGHVVHNEVRTDFCWIQNSFQRWQTQQLL